MSALRRWRPSDHLSDAFVGQVKYWVSNGTYPSDTADLCYALSYAAWKRDHQVLTALLSLVLTAVAVVVAAVRHDWLQGPLFFIIYGAGMAVVSLLRARSATRYVSGAQDPG